MIAISLRRLARSGRHKSLGKGRRAAFLGGTELPLLLMMFLGFVLLVGGSSRADTTSLVILRPVAVLVAGYAMLTLPSHLWRQNWFVIALAGVIVLLPALQLVPLPPAVWMRLAGRNLVTGIDQAAGLGDLWRPLTLSPEGTWNALFSLAVPIGVLFAGLKLDERQRLTMVPFALAMILASAALGALQVMGPNGGPLYLYRITHSDSAVGFLANRNHEAAFVACAFPIVALLGSHSAFAGRIYSRPLFAAIVVAFLIPMVLIIGSRAGLAVSAVAIGLGAALYVLGLRERGERMGRRVGLFLAVACTAVPGLAALAIWLNRAEALRRALGWKADSDFRLQAWSVIGQFLRDFWPWGTGMGSFVEVYKVYEPRALLNPEYLNQAHNDWLEIMLTGGIFAVGPLAVAIGTWLWRAWEARKRAQQTQLTRLGLAVILLFALASVTDYPLRVPSMAAFFVLAVLWALPTRSVLLGRTP